MTYHFARPKEAMRHIICCTEIGRSAEAQFIYLSSPSIITDYDYDDALRLKTLTHHFNPDYLGNSGTRIYSYTRDAAGWVIDFKIDGVSDNYSHDDNGQVLSGSGGSYSYDLNGNRTMGGYVTGADNRLANDLTYTYYYDNEGNRTVRFSSAIVFNNATNTYDPAPGTPFGTEVVNYRYDNRHQLIDVITRRMGNYNDVSTDELRYGYDADGRRVLRREDTDGDGVFANTRYVYDGDALALESAWVFDGQAVSQFSKYIAGPDGTALGEEQLYFGLEWFASDHQNSVRDVYVANHYITGPGLLTLHFDGFGVGDISGIGYANGFTDHETKLIHLGARDYDPGTGTWIQQDPIGFAGGDMSLSRYVGNDPIDYVDPWGLSALELTGHSSATTSSWLSADSEPWSHSFSASMPRAGDFGAYVASQLWAANPGGGYDPTPDPHDVPPPPATQAGLNSMMSLIAYNVGERHAGVNDAENYMEWFNSPATSKAVGSVGVNAFTLHIPDMIGVTNSSRYQGRQIESYRSSFERISLATQLVFAGVGMLGRAAAAASVETGMAAEAASASEISGLRSLGGSRASLFANERFGAEAAEAYDITAGSRPMSLPDPESLSAARNRLSLMKGEAAEAFSVRIDPRVPGRPDPRYSIDTNTFVRSSLPTANGGLRNSREFWQQWAQLYPQSLSPANRLRIQAGQSPWADAAWIRGFPEHSYEGFLNRSLIHHHLNQGRYAIPVPRATHQGFGGPWHFPR